MAGRWSGVDGRAHTLTQVADPAAPPAPLHVVAPRVLEMRGIVKRWRRDRPPVLDGVDLALEGGTAVRISGVNGAGKTTLLRIAAGLIGCDAGTSAIAGLDPVRERREYQRRIGLVTAGSAGLYARLSVRRHLELWSRLSMLAPDERGPAIARAIADFRLEELADSRVDRISMGQRQRVRLAMAFMHEPLVALLDEPVNSLDEEGAQLLGAAVHALRLRGGAALWCCPSGEASRFDFDRACVVDAGALRDE